MARELRSLVRAMTAREVAILLVHVASFGFLLSWLLGLLGSNQPLS